MHIIASSAVRVHEALEGCFACHFVKPALVMSDDEARYRAAEMAAIIDRQTEILSIVIGRRITINDYRIGHYSYRKAPRSVRRHL